MTVRRVRVDLEHGATESDALDQIRDALRRARVVGPDEEALLAQVQPMIAVLVNNSSASMGASAASGRQTIQFGDIELQVSFGNKRHGLLGSLLKRLNLRQ